jgi:hypothetical protein
MKEKKMDKKPDDTDYNFKGEDKSLEEQIDEKLKDEEKRHLEAEDIHILDIAKNPPEQGYMRSTLNKAELYTKGETEKAVKITVIAMPLEEIIMGSPPIIPKDPNIFINANGEQIRIFDPIFDIDLKQMADGQVSDCASTIFPMLLDQYVNLAVDEKKARAPEKRKEEFKWWWILVLILILVPIILITMTILPGLFG